MKQPQPTLVSIILVNYNGAEVLPDCINSIEKFMPISDCEIIIVDNASNDGSPELVAHNPHVNLIKLSENLGFGAGNNAGARIATGEFLLLLNTDTILTSNILPHLINLIDTRPEVGIIGPKLLNADGSLQISISPAIGIKGESQARQLNDDYEKNHNIRAIEQKFQKTQEVDIVVGAAFFIRADLFHTLGGFDEKFFMYFEESDLCQRAQNIGYKILYTPDVSLIHLKGYSIQKAANAMAVEYRRSQIYYYQKHRPLWEQLVLRLYLLYKFSREFVTSANPNCLKILLLALTKIY